MTGDNYARARGRAQGPVPVVLGVRLPEGDRRTPMALVGVQIGPVVVTLACCALRRGGMEVRLPEDVERQPGVAFAPELKTLIEELVVEAANADPEARKHLAQWRWRR